MKKTFLAKCIAVVAGSMVLSTAAQAAVVFQANFNGNGTGTGGANDVVAFGGTGAIFQYSTATTSIQSTPTLGQGSFLNVSVGAAPSNGNLGGATLTPASSANSWAAMNTVSGGVVNLHGAADFFFRNDVMAGGTPSILDIGSASGGGIRLIVQPGATSTRFRLYSGGTGSEGFLTGGPSYTTPNPNAIIDAAYTISAGTTYHLGITMSTDTGTGVSTMQLFMRDDTQAIDTTTNVNLLNTLNFKINGANVTSGLASGAFAFNVGGNSTNQDAAGRQSSADAFRMYDSVPTTFSAIPEPATLGLLAIGGLMMLPRSCRR